MIVLYYMLCKLLGPVIAKYLLDFIENNNLFYPTQHRFGYRIRQSLNFSILSIPSPQPLSQDNK